MEHGAFRCGSRGVLLRLPGYVGGLPRQPVPRDVVAVALADDRATTDRWSVDFAIDIALFRRAVVACPAGAIFSLSQLVGERLDASSESGTRATQV